MYIYIYNELVMLEASSQLIYLYIEQHKIDTIYIYTYSIKTIRHIGWHSTQSRIYIWYLPYSVCCMVPKSIFEFSLFPFLFLLIRISSSRSYSWQQTKHVRSFSRRNSLILFSLFLSFLFFLFPDVSVIFVFHSQSYIRHP